jgi:hypothetical protein
MELYVRYAAITDREINKAINNRLIQKKAPFCFHPTISWKVFGKFSP